MSKGRAALFTFLITYLGLSAVGFSYFASFVHNELNPYFAEHGMEKRSSDAHEVFTHLLVSAILLWCSVLVVILVFCRETDRERSGSTCGSGKGFIFCLFLYVLVVLESLTFPHVWDSWQYFEANNLPHLASNCHGLGGMTLAFLILTTIIGIIITIVFSCNSERGHR
ncbi:hypothetical protein F5Y00DRAFT_274021 [Daldinia vernicosa]|uniref:uncharacterized protein n=1 Tax=Daldinia vernicosa TaxID=114800 RepID=UPI00200779E6|nr:uncharacterized protein F5Y00DRAFT_274021 [Daldinia vernicosa]KAI0844403.1 hypothetical protein F5Y00DRAFT_274021 [Daldinia vernicosa]